MKISYGANKKNARSVEKIIARQFIVMCWVKSGGMENAMKKAT